MIYVRGSKRDYEKWAEDVRDTMWGWEECLRGFREVEGCDGLGS